MDKGNLKENLISLIRAIQNFDEKMPISSETELSSLGFDNNAKADILVACEAKFSLALPYECTDKWKTVADIVETLQDYI